MSQTTARALHQVNLVVKDMSRALAFYRRLGLTIDEAGRPEWAPHHATAILPNGLRLELDSVAFARQWNPGLRAGPGGAGGVLFFGVETPESVDALFAEMTGAGYVPQKAPDDAFWGARYAIIEDADGNAVGIMSPIDASRRRAPPPPPFG